MGILSRITLILFIFSTIGMWSQVTAEKFEGIWIVATVSIVSGILFAYLGAQEDKL